MQHVTHVGFINSHSECIRRDHHPDIIVQNCSWLWARSSSVIPRGSACRQACLQQTLMQIVHVFTGRCVYNARLAGMLARVVQHKILLLSPRSTLNARLSRPSPVTWVCGSCKRSSRRISPMTSGVAVAVKAATTGRSGKLSTNGATAR